METLVAPRAGLEFVGTDSSAPKRRPLLLVLVLVAVAAAGGMYLRSAGTAEAATFRYAFEAGETQTYAMTMQVKMTVPGGPGEAPAPISESGTITVRVAEVDASGNATVEVRVSGLQTQPEQTVTMRVAPDGRVLDAPGDLFSPGAAQPRDLFTQFPSKPLAPGDTWDTTQQLPFMAGKAVTVRTKGVHEGYEDTAYGRAARVKTETTVPLNLSLPIGALLGAFGGGGAGVAGDATMTMTGTMQAVANAVVVPATGDLVRVQGEIDMDMKMSASGLPESPGELGIRGTISMTMVRTA